MKPLPIPQRFWSKVQKSFGCWIWTATRNSFGYGVLHSGPVHFRAHRISWELHFGPIPEGQCVLHHCDNPPCVNPDHLFLGSHADNVADMVTKGRQSIGSLNGATKLDESDVRVIRAAYKEGMSQRSIGRCLSISDRHVSRIISAKRWQHLGIGPLSTAGRRAKGERHWKAKLSEQQVRDIFARSMNGCTRTKLAKEFSVSPALIWMIATGRSWRHLNLSPTL